SRFRTRWALNWMEARAASAYALVSEAIWLVHGQEMQTDREALITHLIEAAMYLRTLVIAMDDKLEPSDGPRACEVITRLGARHRPRLEWRDDPRDYLVDAFCAARTDLGRLRDAFVKLREREGPLV